MKNQKLKVLLISVAVSLFVLMLFINPLEIFDHKLSPQTWAQVRQLTIIGTMQDDDALRYSGFNPAAMVDPSTLLTLLGFNETMELLMSLPPKFYKVFEPQYNYWSTIYETKAIYFGVTEGRGFSFSMPCNFQEPEYKNVLPGFYIGQHARYTNQLEQFIYTVAHEVGHLVDLFGVRVRHYHWKPIWTLDSEDMTEFTSQVFDAKGILITNNANANIFEDFADHFAWYILKGRTFREQALHNEDLAERYNFLKIYLFNNVEYDDGITSLIMM